MNEIDIVKNMKVNAISFKNEIHSSNVFASFICVIFLFFSKLIDCTRKTGKFLFDFNLSIAKNHANDMRE